MGRTAGRMERRTRRCGTALLRYVRSWLLDPIRCALHDYVDPAAHTKIGLPRFFTLVRMGAGGCHRYVLLAFFAGTNAESSGPTLPVVCNMVDRGDGREDHSRVSRTRGRRGLCCRDHATARGSSAHIRVRRLRAHAGCRFKITSIYDGVSGFILKRDSSSAS